MRHHLSRMVGAALWVLLVLGLTSNSLQAIEFTGDVTADFADDFCIDDPDGLNLAFPGSFPFGTVSGFDIEQLCLVYDLPDNTLYIGVKTFDDGGGDPIIFGDTDGDGDPGGTSAALAALGGEDWAKLSEEEFFSFIFNLDNDGATPPDFIAGISAERSAPLGLRVSEVSLPHMGESFSFLSAYYGDTLSPNNDSYIHASPTAQAPHLELAITNASELPGANSLNLEDPDETVSLTFKAGSLGDTVIGEEDFPLTITLMAHLDSDSDDIPSAQDPDQDNDGIPDVTEKNLDGFDQDGDGLLNAQEIIDSGLDQDGDGDIDINDGINFQDTDGDGIPDYLDRDADGDTILDIHEANTYLRDANNNLAIDPDEYNDLDTNNSFDGGDNSGALHNDELPDTDDDGLPDYRDIDSDNDKIYDAAEAGDTNLNTPPIDTDGDDIPNYRDTDSDGDGIFDSVESGDDDLDTPPQDSDDDGLPDFIDTDSDNDGVSDSEEVDTGSDPTDPQDSEGNDQDNGSGNSGNGNIQAQGSGLGGCALSEQSTVHLPWYLLLAFLPWVLVCGLKKKLLYLTVLVITPCLVPAKASALNIEHFRPNFDQQGLINLYDSRALPLHNLRFGFNISYSHQPMEIGVIGTGRRVDPLVDYQVGMTLNAAYGLTEHITVALWVPFFPIINSRPIGGNRSRTKVAFGDIGMGAKLHLMTWDSTHLEVGLAVVPFLNFPSGSTSNFTGDKTVTGGLRTVLDFVFSANKVITNFGFRLREKEDLLNLSVGQELLFGVGYTRPLSEGFDLHALTEFSGSVALNGAFTRINRAPIEWLFGLKKGFWEQKAHLTLGGSVGLTTGYGVPDFRIFSMMDFTPLYYPKVRDLPPPPEPELAQVRGEQIVILQPIHFDTAQATIRSVSLPVIESVARLLKSRTEIKHVVVKGHTDSRGSDAYNLDLSQRRADAVRSALIERGIAANRLSAEGWGEKQPIADEYSQEGMAQNRRVEFHITSVTRDIVTPVSPTPPPRDPEVADPTLDPSVVELPE